MSGLPAAADSNEAVYSHDGPGLRWSIRVPVTMPPEEAEFFLSILELVKQQVVRRCLALHEQQPSGQEQSK